MSGANHPTPDEKGPTGDYRDDYEQYRPDRQASVTSKPMTATQINAIQEEALGLMRELNEYAQKHYRSQPRCTCDLMSICTHLYSALIKRLGSSSDETIASPQAPIARIKVKADRCYAVELYAPGLPPGEHDLYCEPEAVAPRMREKRAYYETHDPPHCPTCACGMPREDACSCGRVELKDGYVRATCPDGSVHTKGGCNSPSKANLDPSIGEKS